jgi:hypothetical protein
MGRRDIHKVKVCMQEFFADECPVVLALNQDEAAFGSYENVYLVPLVHAPNECAQFDG